MKPILHHCILQQHLQKYYVTRKRSHNPFLLSFVRCMAGYLFPSVPYTKYILLTFYLCIACHAFTNYFFVFNPQKSCMSVRSYASSKSAKPQYIRHNLLSDIHSQFFSGCKMSPNTLLPLTNQAWHGVRLLWYRGHSKPNSWHPLVW
jgi:hypothetical protein